MSWLTELQFACLPGRCILCDAYTYRQMDLCSACEATLPACKPGCQRCGLPLAANSQICSACLIDPPLFDRTWCPYLYAWPIDSMISDFKHTGHLTTGRVLAELMLNIQPDQSFDLMIPVPLHPRTERKRGFNQAVEIASVLSKAWKLPLDKGNCRRIIQTPEQKQLNRSQRFRNIRNAFALKRPYHGERILILDDVVTTTATVSVLAELLLENGAGSVSVMCLARTA